MRWALLLIAVGCSSSQPAAPACATDYPASTSIAFGAVLPDLELGGGVKLRDYHEPCAEKSRLLMIRVSAAWCGTCRWQVAHTPRNERVRLLDLLVADEDNAAATVEDLDAWKKRIDAPQALAIDPEFRLGKIMVPAGPLPLIVLVDTKTMRAVNYLNDPDPQTLDLRIRQELATLDGAPQPALDPLELSDARLTRNQVDMLKEMTLPGAPPPDPTNAKADDPAAAALGKKLFSDALLSPSGKVSCATCHDPAKEFTDGLPQSQGVARVAFNAPSVLLAAHSRWQFWDGRADSLWMQATGPLENDKEMGSSRLYVAHQIEARYKSEYEAVFGALDVPALASGKPGDPAYDALPPEQKRSATRVLANVGKAIAAFERTLRVKPNRLDAYIAGDTTALNDLEKRGLRDFFLAGCAQCHYGPRLTNDAFHSLRFPGRERGRIDAVPKLLASEMNAAGEYSDAPRPVRARPGSLAAFKTPTLRGIAGTGPYGHDGMIPTLTELVKIYGTAGLPPEDPSAIGTTEPWVPKFAQEHHPTIEAFLKVLSAPPAD
jgi:cytochrome c peroxidase